MLSVIREMATVLLVLTCLLLYIQRTDYKLFDYWKLRSYIMSTRGKCMVAMVCHKDKVRLEQLEIQQPIWDTTEGSNLTDVDRNKLKSFFCETTSKKTEDVTLVDFESNISIENNGTNGKGNALTDLLYEQNTGKNVIIQSCVVIPPTDLQPSYNANTISTSYYDESFQPNSVKPEEHLIRLTNVPLTYSDSSDSCNDSGSEYIPPSVSSFGTYSEFSSDSNHSVLEKSKKPLLFHESEQAEKSNTNVPRSLDERNKEKEPNVFNQFGEVTSSSRNLNGKLKRDKRENCVYCEKNVTNFARHLIRNHDKEFEVLKVMSLPKHSRERKYLLDEIRKRGNFINAYGKEGFINPVRRPKSVYQKKTADYLPCSGCKGFFTRTYLLRHIKKCYKKFQEGDSKHAQAKGLTLLYMSGENNFEDLKLNVFPHMQSDDITKIVMNDFLIKYYGQRYYRCHKEQHLINTVSQRMRELARFLKTLQDKEPKLCNLADYLKPCYFDYLVDATTEMSGYDADKDTFKSPSLALRWATVLKQVCDIAMFLTTKEGEAARNKEIKTLRQMIETQFRFYVSTNANKDLSSKTWKKGSMLPLTEDVIKMNEFVVEEEERWAKVLQSDPNNLLYLRNLTEIILAHVILLNRKRSGEAQRITIEDYLRKEDESGVKDIYQSLTVTEKVLVKNIKRFIIRGKKGRAVPVIFTKDMQKHTEILLKSRKFVASSNPYLFANPSTKDSFLWSYKVLKKIAVACNIKNIEAVTATHLRKHIATIAQLISLEGNDLEQLSTHLGHEKATHLNYYRKTDDKLQIAKVSKLLLLMEKKSLGEYRGQTLEHIDLEIPDLDETENDTSFSESSKLNKLENVEKWNEDCNREHNDDNLQFAEHRKCLPKRRMSSNSVENSGEVFSENHKDQVKKARVLVPWTSEQKRFAQIFFKKHLTLKKPPKKTECEELKELYPSVFSNKTWPQIKIFIVNQYNKK